MISLFRDWISSGSSFCEFLIEAALVLLTLWNNLFFIILKQKQTVKWILYWETSHTLIYKEAWFSKRRLSFFFFDGYFCEPSHFLLLYTQWAYGSWPVTINALWVCFVTTNLCHCLHCNICLEVLISKVESKIDLVSFGHSPSSILSEIRGLFIKLSGLGADWNL